MSRWQSADWNETSPGEEAEEELEGEWELDPNDPAHPDYDLSEAAGYAYWEPAPKPWYVRRGVILLVTILVILGLLIPVLARLY